MDQSTKRLPKNLQTLILISVLLVSCSAEHHLNKAIKKGYKCEEVSDTIRITSVDSFPVIVNDTIVWQKYITQKDTVVMWHTQYVPMTKWEKKIQYKYKTKYIKAEAQKVKYQNKYITKTKINWFIVILAFIIGFLVRLTLSETFRGRLQLLTKLFK
jgi:hypothetical protein